MLEEIYEEQTFLSVDTVATEEEKVIAMTPEEKKNFVLEEQANRTPASEIADKLGITLSSLRSLMSRHGYRSDNGIFKPKNYKEDNSVQGKLDILNVGDDFVKNEEKPIKYVKISLKLYEQLMEMYNWYLQVKDSAKLRVKTTKKNKELTIQEDYSDEEYVSFKANIPESIAKDFERFSANSNYDTNDIVTQALSYYMADNNHLL